MTFGIALVSANPAILVWFTLVVVLAVFYKHLPAFPLYSVHQTILLLFFIFFPSLLLCKRVPLCISLAFQAMIYILFVYLDILVLCDYLVF